MTPRAPAAPGLNRRAAALVQALIEDCAALRVAAETTRHGATILDAGIDCAGGVEAGLRIAEICMAGLGRVTLAAGGALGRWPWTLNVHTSDPVLACLGSQLAGWQLSGDGYHALGSGPGRALAAKEPLFAELDLNEEADSACLVLEVDRRPPDALIEKVARDCRIDPAKLVLILTPTRSLAGTVQIVARVLEVALHKLHELRFPLAQVVDGMGAAPLPPPAPSFVEAMGRTNDAIIYGGCVQLYVRGSDEAARELAKALPSTGSRDYGRPFAEIFRAYKGDFYAMDRLLFSPALVTVTALDSGRSFTAGRLNPELIDRSFGGAGA
ncbi:MAG: methenyltetrahydromethanopterin cyclohydrolase [Rhodospirillaceae bacterium]|nr:methenyltetrahydromethanopterin cyclohydrolase [Rhodospirillaceae bacterium]